MIIDEREWDCIAFSNVAEEGFCESFGIFLELGVGKELRLLPHFILRLWINYSRGTINILEMQRRQLLDSKMSLLSVPVSFSHPIWGSPV